MRPLALASLLLASGALAGVTVPAAQSPVADTAPPYQWLLPPGFPRPNVPADNPMSADKVTLGRSLFSNPALSANESASCATCHRPELAFTDARSRAVGSRGDTLARSAPTLANVAYLPAYTWADPTLRSLEAQMLRPLFNEHPVELGLRGHEAELVARLNADPGTRALFATVFPHDARPVSLGNAVKAIAAYERTLISGRSAFDRYVFDDDREALNPAAKRGMALFYSARAGCAACHAGINFSGPIVYAGHPDASADFANTGVTVVDTHGAGAPLDRGLMQVTGRRADAGRFRIPTLRNVALTAPYMHDGSVPTLRAVIERYARGGPDPAAARIGTAPAVDARIHRVAFSPAEIDELLAFLESLTDPGFISAHRSDGR